MGTQSTRNRRENQDTAASWATPNEQEFLKCLVNSDAAANAILELNAACFPSEKAAYLFGVCRDLALEGHTITPESLAAECESRLDPEAAEIAINDLGVSPKKIPKDGWANRAFELADILIENGPVLYSTDTDLDGALGEIEWLWKGYVPRGFVTALIAEQDSGKSTVAQGWCHTLLQGGTWPDNQYCESLSEDQKLLWIDTDGNLALFHGRLKAWKMPRGRFVFPASPLNELSIDSTRDWKWIETVIAELSIPLLIIDALSGFHTGKENDADSMKLVLKKLHHLAQKYKIAIIIIHHLNKPPVGVPAFPITIARLRGSGAISQYCRSIIALTVPDPSTPNERRMDVIKMNLQKKPPPIGYVLSDQGPLWGSAPEPPKAPKAVDGAIDFLKLLFLHTKAIPSDDVFAGAKANGIGESALKGARNALKIAARREGGRDGKWWLVWPGGSIPDPSTTANPFKPENGKGADSQTDLEFGDE